MSQLIFPLPATFLALPLENEAKWQFQALQEDLKPFADILRFQNPQSPHLTLQYWREVMEIEFHQVQEQTQKLAAATAPFTLQVMQAGTFGTRSEDKVLMLELAFSEELARLKKACPWPSGRSFRPHLTLARMRHPQKFAVQKKKIMKLLEDCAFAIPFERLRLYAEINGVKQTPIEDYALSGSSSS